MKTPRTRRTLHAAGTELQVLLAAAALAGALAAIGSLLTARTSYAAWLLTAAVILICLGQGVTAIRALNRFRAAGIRHVDRTIRDGIDPDMSLRICRNELRFLGTGARKLTTSPEFVVAMKRCTASNKGARFLLCKPETKNLQEAAQRAKRRPDEYARLVTDSLRVLAELRQNNHNIEVRFYNGTRPFRLLFVDQKACLVAYNVYGEADAVDFPQLHAVRADPPTRSFYWAFEQYFQQQWNEATPWNFQEYLQA